jgi:hypothetical protein
MGARVTGERVAIGKGHRIDVDCRAVAGPKVPDGAGNVQRRRTLPRVSAGGDAVARAIVELRRQRLLELRGALA